MPRTAHIGLTGSIASGKSSVARVLSEMGVQVIDADVLAREAVAPGSPGLEAVRARFGDKLLNVDGTLNREAMRHLVFRDPASRDALNQIIHPIVATLRERALALAKARQDGVPFVVSDVPLLFEVGLEHEFDGIMFVDAPEHARLQRLMAHRHLPESEARAMMSAQWPSAEKRSRSTWVIDNDGTLEELRPKVQQIWSEVVAAQSSPD